MRKGWFLTRCALGERSCRSRVCSVKHSSVDESCCGEFGKLFVMTDVMIFKPGCVFERTSPWFHIQYKQDICQHGWFGVNIIFKRGLYHIWLSSAVFLQNVTTALWEQIQRFTNKSTKLCSMLLIKAFNVFGSVNILQSCQNLLSAALIFPHLIISDLWAIFISDHEQCRKWFWENRTS